MKINVSRYFKTNINEKIKKQVLKTAKDIESYLNDKVSSFFIKKNYLNIDCIIVYGY